MKEVSMAEWSKAPDSSSGLRKGAWVRTPLLTERNEVVDSTRPFWTTPFAGKFRLESILLGEFLSALALLRFLEDQSTSY